jgi:hypothetical protein
MSHPGGALVFLAKPLRTEWGDVRCLLPMHDAAEPAAMAWF